MIPKGLRKAVLARDGWRCHYCDDKLYPTIFASTVDHKVPRCRGGLDVMENLVSACSRCNNAKGDMTYELFLSIWRECLDAGGDLTMVEGVCVLWQRRNSFTPATHWNAVLCGTG